LFDSAGEVKLSAVWAGLFGKGRVDWTQLEIVRPDRTSHPVELTGCLHLRNGQLAGVQLELRDASATARLREELRLSQKLAAVGTLAAGLAHDFNNVLTVVKGYSDMLGVSPQVLATAQKYLRQIATACERGAHLTRQLLTFSRRRLVELRPLDLNEAVANISPMLRRLVGENIVLQFNFTPGLPAIEADLGMVEQVLSNLVIHGRQMMPAGGTLRVETGLAHASQLGPPPDVGPQTGPYVWLSVTDTSGGLERQATSQLLETPPGVDLERPPRLGLHIANSVSRQLGGWMEIVDIPGEGTSLKLCLPASERKAGALAQVAQPEPVKGGTETILVVEDEPSLRELAKAILVNYGYRVLEAGTGEEAVQVWEQHAQEIQLLFTDIVMPGSMTGRVLAEVLAARQPGLRIVYTTGYSPDLVLPGPAARLGINLLPKPYGAWSLGQAVRRALDTPPESNA
jgi:signal transduction histidine kinase/CheY-like chemotaxis protein